MSASRFIVPIIILAVFLSSFTTFGQANDFTINYNKYQAAKFAIKKADSSINKRHCNYRTSEPSWSVNSYRAMLQVKGKSNELYRYIETQIQTYLEIGGNLDNKARQETTWMDTNLAKREVLLSGRAKKLRQHIIDTRKKLSDYDFYSANENRLMPLNSGNSFVRIEVKKWETDHFGHGKSLIAVICDLKIMQLDIREWEVQVCKGTVEKPHPGDRVRDEDMPPPAEYVAPPPPRPDVFTYVEQMPTPGYDVQAWINEHLIIPADAREWDGRELVKFVVNEDSTISDVVVVRGLIPSIDSEAKRVVSLLPKFKPGMQNGRAVKCYYILPVALKSD
jgi:GldM N-terminal domain/Gram-negative bacterial TonB protein C-terminal